MNKEIFTLIKVLSSVFLIIILLFFFFNYADEKNEFEKKIKQNNFESNFLSDTLIDMNVIYSNKYKIIGVISPNDCSVCYTLLINEFNNLINDNDLKNSVAVYVLDQYNSGSSFRDNLLYRFRPRYPIILLNKNNLLMNNFFWFIKTPFLLQLKANGNLTGIMQININNQETFFKFIDRILERENASIK